MEKYSQTKVAKVVIKLKYEHTPNSLAPKYTACQLARATKCNPEVVKQKAVKKQHGIESCDCYEIGDLFLWISLL